MILGGWIGTIMGLILTFAFVDNDIINHFGDLFNRIGAAMITLFYGYMLGIVFSFISLGLIITFIYHICQGNDQILTRIKA